MKWRKNLRLSMVALWRTRGRTLLSIAGMAVGIAAVAAVVALGAGADRALRRVLEQMGRNQLVLNAGRTETGPLRGRSQQYETLKLADAETLSGAVAGIERVAPVATGTRRLRFRGRTLSTTVTGTTPELLEIRNHHLVVGRFLDEDDVRDARRVAVLGSYVVRELCLGEWPLGATLEVGGIPFTVVGVLRKKGSTSEGSNEDDQIVVPVSAAQRRVLNVDFLDRVFVQADSEDALPEAERAIDALLRRRHGRRDFEIQNQAALLAAKAKTGDSLSRVVRWLAVVTLALGGVGLLAVSLLSVRERYGEIGLRLAVGARRRDVALQFLAEAVMIGLLGGAAGLLAGGAAILLGEQWSGWPLVLTWRSVVYPFAVSLAVAVVSGAYPAIRASRLDPIVALRSA